MKIYEPFFVKETPLLTEEDGLVFSISGDKNIDLLPSYKLVENIDFNGVKIKEYKDGNSMIANLFAQGKQLSLQNKDGGWKRFETDGSFTNPDDFRLLKLFLVTAYGLSTSHLKTFKIHSSVIEKEGKALLFLGKSGTGKSTHSRLWLQHVEGCSLLNDDEPIVRLMPDNTVRVFGAPWSGSTPCYRNESAEVVAFVQLEQHSENIIRKVNGVEALRYIVEAAAILGSSATHRNRVINTISDILEKIPVYKLQNLPNEEAARMTEKLLTEK